MYVGGVYQIIYTGTEQVPTFTSENDAIATVSASGLVTAIGLGSTTIRGSITREDGTISTATCYITVSDNQPITITLSTISNRVAINKPFGEDNIVFISVYDSRNKQYYNAKVEAILESRKDNKELVLEKILDMFSNII